MPTIGRSVAYFQLQISTNVEGRTQIRAKSPNYSGSGEASIPRESFPMPLHILEERCARVAKASPQIPSKEERKGSERES